MENQDVLEEGLAYIDKLKDVDPANTKLGAEVLYNFICLGIESVLTSVLMAENKMVDHSGISNMLRELQTVEPVNEKWLEAARRMNRFSNYCTLEPVAVKIPTTEELEQFIQFGQEVGEYAKARLVV